MSACSAGVWPSRPLFHLAGNHALVEGTARPLALVLVQAAVGLTSLAVLLRPRRSVVVVLAALLPVSAWAEAPAVGNHWVLAAAVGLTYLVAAAVTAARRRPASEVARSAVPPCGWCCSVPTASPPSPS